MRLVVFLLLLLLGVCSGNVQILIDQNGGYNITVNNKLWLRSARTAIYVDDQWHSTDNGSLPLASITTGQGTDPYLGNWNETLFSYNLIRNQTTTKVVARIRQWSIVPAFTFYLETGDTPLTFKVPLDMEEVRTVFPSFFIEKTDANDQRGYFVVGGGMGGEDDKHAGLWNASSKVIRSGMYDSPVVLFDLAHKGENDTMILSPFSHFMATSLHQRGRSTDSALEYGVMGSMAVIPANYTQAFILFYSPNGINSGIQEWGATMQRAYNRTDAHRLNDLTINYLGYYTNNGGYYYYNTEPGVNYEQTIIDVAHQLNFPYHYIEFDSWWYYKDGLKGGVTEWRAMPEVFPDGLVALHRRIENVPLGAHNRWWAYDNVYRPKYAFAVDPGNKKSLPIGNDSFWLDFFVEAHNWGLILYVQDWLAVQTREFVPTRTDINIGERWLKSMGEAADQVGINIQYCMSFPRNFLQAVEIPRVTHARASDDYAVSLMNHKKPQWNIGITSMILDAIGIAPFKDVLWSTPTQPGSPYSSNASELVPDRQIAIATLSTGPVAVGDGLNFTNVERIMKCCRKDGLILKPDRAITAINEAAADWVLDDGGSQVELYSTETTINDRTFYVLFASALKNDYTVYPSMIRSESGVIWSYDNVAATSTFDDTHPVQVTASKCNDLSVCVWYVSPVWQFNDPVRTKYALLGEINKWTAVSRQRFASITTNIEKTQTTIVIQGVPSEVVSIGVYHSNFQSMNINCTMSNTSGQSNLVITPANVACS